MEERMYLTDEEIEALAKNAGCKIYPAYKIRGEIANLSLHVGLVLMEMGKRKFLSDSTPESLDFKPCRIKMCVHNIEALCNLGMGAYKACEPRNWEGWI